MTRMGTKVTNPFYFVKHVRVRVSQSLPETHGVLTWTKEQITQKEPHTCQMISKFRLGFTLNGRSLSSFRKSGHQTLGALFVLMSAVWMAANGCSCCPCRCDHCHCHCDFRYAHTPWTPPCQHRNLQDHQRCDVLKRIHQRVAFSLNVPPSRKCDFPVMRCFVIILAGMEYFTEMLSRKIS